MERYEEYNPNIDRYEEFEPYYGFDTMIGNARIKSTRKNIKISYNGETIRLSKRKLKKLFVKIAASVIALSFLGHIAALTVEKIAYYLEVFSVRTEQSKEAEELLKSNNLNVKASENGDWCNDYSKVKGLSEDDIYGFYHYFGYEETEEVIKALGYTSWDNYLSVNGYFVREVIPSVEVWENYVEYELVTERREALENDRSY